VGTGFLVREGVVMTNRHVIDDLNRAVEPKKLPESEMFLLFIVFRAIGKLQQLAITPRKIRATYTVRDGRLDIGFIRFNVVHPQHFHDVEPVELDDPASIRVSEEIAVFGYPHGNALLEKDGRVNRWGPVVQQGWISGISPYESFGPPEEFLLDVRVAHGISGAPVFRPRTGTVCGVLHSGIGTRRDNADVALTTTAFAQPISDTSLANWLAEFDRELHSTD
jgi:V8-like Glu-specific endopeptidase